MDRMAGNGLQVEKFGQFVQVLFLCLSKIVKKNDYSLFSFQGMP